MSVSLKLSEIDIYLRSLAACDLKDPLGGIPIEDPSNEWVFNHPLNFCLDNCQCGDMWHMTSKIADEDDNRLVIVPHIYPGGYKEFLIKRMRLGLSVPGYKTGSHNREYTESSRGWKCLGHSQCIYCEKYEITRDVLKKMKNYCIIWNVLEYTIPNVKKSAEFRSIKWVIPKEKTIKVENASMTWYSIVPKKRLPYDKHFMGKLQEFCMKCFSCGKHIRNSWWVVESGKHEDSPNLHVHCLVDFHTSRNFRRWMLKVWEEFFPDPDYRITWERKDPSRPKGVVKGIDHVICNTREMIRDKHLYMINSNKGTHENFSDLGINGAYHLDQSS